MIRWYYKHRIGYTYVYEDGMTKIGNIFGGNCLCVFTEFYKDEKTGKNMESMNCFFLDEKHLKRFYNRCKDMHIYMNLRSVRLNTYYKESFILAKYFALDGIKVTLYYKEPQDKLRTSKK